MTLTTEQLRARAAAIRCEALSKADQGFAFQSQRLYETAAALDELAANREAQQDGWIACSIRMPEPNKYVQVSNGAWVGIGMYNDAEHFEDDERWQDEHHEFIDLLHHPVTHWMPLSAPPQEV